MLRISFLLAATGLLAGCAVYGPLPDGSHIERLSQTTAVPPAAPIAQAAPTARAAPAARAAPVPMPAQRLEQINAQVLADQNAALRQEAELEAWRRSQSQVNWYVGWPVGAWYWGGGHGAGWGGWVGPGWGWGWGGGWHHGTRRRW